MNFTVYKLHTCSLVIQKDFYEKVLSENITISIGTAVL